MIDFGNFLLYKAISTWTKTKLTKWTKQAPVERQDQYGYFLSYM